MDIFTVKMPDIGEGVVEGEVVKWLKKPEDPLSQDEPVIVLMTDKATVELPAPYPGKLHKQYYKEGDIAIKGKPLYDIALSEPLAHKASKAEPVVNVKNGTCPQAKAEVRPPVTTQAPLESIRSDHARALALPRTRQLAKKLGVEIDEVEGTGPSGRVLEEDIIAYHAGEGLESRPSYQETPITRLPDDEEKPLVGVRGLMARSMAESKRQIPHFSYFEQLEATRLIQIREKFKSKALAEGISISYMPFLIKALSLSLTRFPIVNSSVDMANKVIVTHRAHNIGIAMSTPLGLIVPVLKGVERMSLVEVIRAYQVLKDQAAAGKLSSNDMKEGTITISNFGVLSGNGLWATPVIRYPEAAILAIAKIHQEPVIRNSEVTVRNVLNLSWSFDHRIIDGELAAQFSHYFSTLLQNPAPLI